MRHLLWGEVLFVRECPASGSGMTNILSMISGSFSRVLLLGTFFPVTVFALLFYLVVVPFFPADIAVLRPLRTLDTAWTTALLTLLLIVISGILYNLNVPITRLYEGYSWRDSRIGGWAHGRELRRLEWAMAEKKKLGSLTARLRQANPRDPAIEEIEGLRTHLAQRVVNEYPGTALVLPTRLGNAIRSFEEYPRAVYGISAITVWPRLVGVISKEYGAMLDESKSTFDFMINASFLSWTLAASTLAAGLLVPTRVQPWQWAAQVVLAFVAGYLFYRGSIGAALAWGAQVKGAFDLFRWDLLEKLGYARASITPAQEKALWQEISQRMIFGKLFRTPLQPYTRGKPQPFEG